MEPEQNALLGKKINRYELRQVVGEGGMATVFRAYDPNLDREVALKLFRREAFSLSTARRMLKRFNREAKALARLSHPNIVEILDYGSYEDSLFMVMKYLPGGTLKEKISSILPYSEAARILIPIARALDYAHQEGIIHRDVKPANILLTKMGEPMLSDFGIAKILEEDKSISLTATNIGVGTPEYMAPEQWINKVSPRSDIYALGMVYYELVTGIKPFSANTPTGVAIKQATEPLPDPRGFIPGLPEEVVRVIFKSLAHKPESRYETMAIFAGALETLSVGINQTPRDVLETADDLPPFQNIPVSHVDPLPPVKTDFPSRVRSPKVPGKATWVAIQLLLTLILGGLMIGVAILSVSGVLGY